MGFSGPRVDILMGFSCPRVDILMGFSGPRVNILMGFFLALGWEFHWFLWLYHENFDRLLRPWVGDFDVLFWSRVGIFLGFY